MKSCNKFLFIFMHSLFLNFIFLIVHTNYYGKIKLNNSKPDHPRHERTPKKKKKSKLADPTGAQERHSRVMEIAMGSERESERA
jgi:hypothetical protein